MPRGVERSRVFMNEQWDGSPCEQVWMMNGRLLMVISSAMVAVSMGKNVGKVWGVDRWAEADIAEADTPLWVNNIEGASLEVTEVEKKQPENRPKAHIEELLDDLWWIASTEVRYVALEGGSGATLGLHGALIDHPLHPSAATAARRRGRRGNLVKRTAEAGRRNRRSGAGLLRDLCAFVLLHEVEDRMRGCWVPQAERRGGRRAVRVRAANGCTDLSEIRLRRGGKSRETLESEFGIACGVGA